MKEIKLDKTKFLCKHNDHVPYYNIVIKCDARNCDYMSTSFNYYGDTINDLTLLMLTYFSYSYYKIPKNWNDIPKETPTSFGGSFINKNKRFNRKGEKDNWLAQFAIDTEILLYAGMIDKYCHSIASVEIFYYDKDMNMYKCGLPNLGEIFKSEHEFIEYVRALDDENMKEADEMMKGIMKQNNH